MATIRDRRLSRQPGSRALMTAAIQPTLLSRLRTRVQTPTAFRNTCASAVPGKWASLRHHRTVNWGSWLNLLSPPSLRKAGLRRLVLYRTLLQPFRLTEAIAARGRSRPPRVSWLMEARGVLPMALVARLQAALLPGDVAMGSTHTPAAAMPEPLTAMSRS